MWILFLFVCFLWMIKLEGNDSGNEDQKYFFFDKWDKPEK